VATSLFFIISRLGFRNARIAYFHGSFVAGTGAFTRDVDSTPASTTASAPNSTARHAIIHSSPVSL
jgi:hypothetical protein